MKKKNAKKKNKFQSKKRDIHFEQQNARKKNCWKEKKSFLNYLLDMRHDPLCRCIKNLFPSCSYFI